jgi:hypothetical protein
MKNALILFSLCLGMTVGFAANEYRHMLQSIECSTYSTKHSKWDGYIAKDEYGDMRCFWLEREYPNRIRQGVPV